MPQIFSILEFTDPAGDVLAARLPADGAADIEWGAQLVVRESQTALLLKDGQLVHAFGPGRYTLDTQNLPVLGKFVTGLVFGKGNTPFKAEVYFVARHL
ncbi:MAG TPA: SPFH domain-containing protein, partial [Humisphaera sp.]